MNFKPQHHSASGTLAAAAATAAAAAAAAARWTSPTTHTRSLSPLAPYPTLLSLPAPLTTPPLTACGCLLQRLPYGPDRFGTIDLQGHGRSHGPISVSVGPRNDALLIFSIISCCCTILPVVCIIVQKVI